MNDYKTITKLFENDQDEIGFRLFKESNIIKLNNKNNNNYDNNQIEFDTQSLASKIINYSDAYIDAFQFTSELKFLEAASRNFSSEVRRFFLSYNTQLPTLYILLKTHKFDVTSLNSNSDIINNCKVRPIVSCCGSPTEKLAWLATHLLTPLLNHVPTHLKKTL